MIVKKDKVWEMFLKENPHTTKEMEDLYGTEAINRVKIQTMELLPDVIESDTALKIASRTFCHVWDEYS